MEYMVKTFIVYLIPCIGGSGQNAWEVPERKLSKEKVPEDAIGYYFFDVIEAEVDFHGEKVELESAKINRSQTHYFQNRVKIVTRKEAVDRRNCDELLQFMGFHRCDRVCDLLDRIDDCWEVEADAILEDF